MNPSYVPLIMPEATSHVAVLRDRPAAIGASAPDVITAWGPRMSKGTRVPAASLKQRMALAPTNDIRGVVVVFDDGVSGSRKWSPPV